MAYFPPGVIPPNAQTMLGMPQQSYQQRPMGQPMQPQPPQQPGMSPQPQPGTPMVDPRLGQRGGFQQMGGGGQMRPQAPQSNTQRAFGSAMQSQVQQPQLMNQFVQGMRMNGGLLGSTTQNAAPAYGYQRLSWQGLMDQRAAEGKAAQEKLAQQQAAATAGAAPAGQAAQSAVSQLTPEQLQMLNMMNMSPDERAWRQAMGGGLYGGGGGGSNNGDSGSGVAAAAAATGGIGVDGQGTW